MEHAQVHGPCKLTRVSLQDLCNLLPPIQKEAISSSNLHALGRVVTHRLCTTFKQFFKFDSNSYFGTPIRLLMPLRLIFIKETNTQSIDKARLKL